MATQGKINLLPKSEFENSPLGKFVDWAINVGRWVVVITEFVVICAFLSRFYFDTELANLFDVISQNKAMVDSNLEFENFFRKTQEKIKTVKSLLADKGQPSNILVSVTQLLPAEINLTSITTEGATLNLTGYGLSIEGISLFLLKLDQSNKFTQINLTGVQQKEASPWIDFSVSSVFKDGNKTNTKI